jgi:hypothetical protein
MHLRIRLLGVLLLTSGALGACQEGGAQDTQAPELLTQQPAPTSPTAGTGPVTPSLPAARTYTREWVVSPSGSDSAAGGSSAPFRTISKAVSVVGPGERITVKAGTYAEPVDISGSARAGTAAAPIRLQGEGMPTLIPGGSTLLSIGRPYWQVDGFNVDVKGQAKYAVAFVGNTQGAVLSGSEVHHGSLGAGISTHGGAVGATIEDNHIHHFSRGTEDAHGVVVQPSSRNITIRNNRIHDNSGDSVQCIGPEGYSTLAPADGVLIEGNEMYANRENGFDIKTCYNVTIRGNVLRDFAAAGVVHMSAANVLIESNDFFNVGKAIAIGGNHDGPVPSNVVVRRNRIRDVLRDTTRGWDGDAIRLENSESAQVVHNTIVRVGNAAIMLGGGTGGATSNLKVVNNILQGAEVLHIGSQAPGLVVANNLYASAAKVYLSGPGTLTLSSWASQGRDTDSLETALQLSSDGNFTPGSSAVDRGRNVGLPFCGAAPDLGAVETGC